MLSGFFPDVLNYSDPWYGQFIFDFSIIIKPIPIFEIKSESEEKTKKNL